MMNMSWLIAFGLRFFGIGAMAVEINDNIIPFSLLYGH